MRALQRRRCWSGGRREKRSDTARNVGASNQTELTTAGTCTCVFEGNDLDKVFTSFAKNT